MGRSLHAKLFPLGRIQEGQKNRVNPIEHYEKFLVLGTAADLGLPKLEAAKNRLAGRRAVDHRFGAALQVSAI